MSLTKTSLQEFLKSRKLNGNFILLTVVKEINEGLYIVGDKSSLGILDLKKNGRTLKIGSGIKLIKPTCVNEYTLISHPHLSNVKTLKNEKINPEQAEISTLENKAKSSSSQTNSSDKILTGDEIRKMSPSTTIPKFNFLVISISRIIQTDSGQYQICGLKDINGMKININLYEKLMNTLELGRVFAAEKIRKFNMKNDGKLETRLQTSKYLLLKHRKPLHLC